MATAAALILTFVLVVITGYYAVQTKRTVDEMREARRAAVRPRIVLVLEYDDLRNGAVWIENIGLGPASDVDVVVRFEPSGMSWRIVKSLLRPGDRRYWNPGQPREQSKPQIYHADAQLPNHTHISVVGHCSDLLGNRHEIAGRLSVATGWQVSRGDTWVSADDAREGRA
jgi:hypothetical protein